MLFSLSTHLQLSWGLLALFVLFALLFGAVFTGGQRQDGSKKPGFSHRVYHNSLLAMLLFTGLVIFYPFILLSYTRWLGIALLLPVLFLLVRTTYGIWLSKKTSHEARSQGEKLIGDCGFKLFLAITLSL
jgi:hypothetical protein